MNLEVVVVLQKMRERLDNSYHWTQGKMARDSRGTPVAPSDNYAVCWCLLGARSVECGSNTALAADVATALGAAVNRHNEQNGYLVSWSGPAIGVWNDEHIHEDVLKLLDSAISFEEAKS